jgi:hypothetical protein
VRDTAAWSDLRGGVAFAGDQPCSPGLGHTWLVLGPFLPDLGHEDLVCCCISSALGFTACCATMVSSVVGAPADPSAVEVDLLRRHWTAEGGGGACSSASKNPSANSKWTTCLEIAGSDGFRSRATMFFSDRLVSEGARRSSADCFHHGTCLSSMVMSVAENGMEAEI